MSHFSEQKVQSSILFICFRKTIAFVYESFLRMRVQSPISFFCFREQYFFCFQEQYIFLHKYRLKVSVTFLTLTQKSYEERATS